MRSFVIPAACGCALAAGLFAAPAEVRAQAGDAIEIGDIYVVGTRRPVRSTADTPAPIDLIGGEDFADQGATDLPNLMRTLVPSYNVNRQPISDEATIVRPANLRGLSPDQTLVFVNGKRRHRAAVITFLGGGVADGSQGPDIGVIPAIALKRVEVLRDTASAQYGSDAIAGVINFVLKDRPDGGVVETQWGRTYEGDGDEYRIAGNVGIPISETGFANLSAQWRGAEPTVRSVQRADAAALIAGGNTYVRQPYAQVWGAPEVSGDYTVFLNSGMELGERAEVYAFGNLSARETEGGFFFRNPNTRGGIFADRLVGDLTPDDGASCPAITPTDDFFSPEEARAYMDTNPNCFVFNERFPGGFTPLFKGEVEDAAGSAGVRGSLDSGLTWDLSYTRGQSRVDYSISNTINPSLGRDTPLQFDLGSNTQTDQVVNASVTYEVGVSGFDSPLHTAAGIEWREEKFEVRAGEPASWRNGVLGPQGFGVGANGFAGFHPSTAGTWSRTNVAGYVDLEADVRPDLTLAAMGRVEEYEDFGNTTDFKVGARYQVNDSVAVRGSASTGFRAPTVGQSRFSKVTTEFGTLPGGGLGLRQSGTVAPGCGEALATGAKPLTPEEAVTYTAGVVTEMGPFSLTADVYNIDVTDRIAISKDFTLDDAAKARIGNNACFPAVDVKEVKYFGNRLETRTQGIDVVASLDLPMESVTLLKDGETGLVFVGSYVNTEVTSYDADFLDEKRVLQLQDALPKFRFNATLLHEQARWSAFTRLNYYGPYTETHGDSLSLLIDADGKFTLDAEVSYMPVDGVELSLGAENLLNTFPTENPHAGVLGSKYPESSPMGFAGGFYYARARYTF